MDKAEFEIVKYYVSVEVSKEYVMILSRKHIYFIVERGNKYGVIKASYFRSLRDAEKMALRWVGDRI